MIADLLPARARKIIYAVLATAVGLEAVWDVVPDRLEGRVLATLTVLGFSLAISQTSDR